MGLLPVSWLATVFALKLINIALSSEVPQLAPWVDFLVSITRS